MKHTTTGWAEVVADSANKAMATASSDLDDSDWHAAEADGFLPRKLQNSSKLEPEYRLEIQKCHDCCSSVGFRHFHVA